MTIRYLLAALFAGALVIASATASPAAATDSVNQAANSLSSNALANKVFKRPANSGRTGIMHFALENRRGHQRKRTARIFHADASDETKVAIYFTAPGAIEETAFLSLDRKDANDDENWLYLPATERVRRLPASQRGDYFMGTDLTYGDIKDNFKFSPEDWVFADCKQSPWPDNELPCLTGTALSSQIAEELGYSRFIAVVDPATWFPQKIRYFDKEGQALKDVVIESQEEIGGAWTAMAFVLTNLQSEHITRVHFTEMEARATLPNSVFSATELEFGIPQLKAEGAASD